MGNNSPQEISHCIHCKKIGFENVTRKSDKIYHCTVKKLKLTDFSKKVVRRKLFHLFLKEKGGYRMKKFTHCFRYFYIVDELSDGRRILLKRPARLNKGIDFEVWVEKFDGYKNKRPSYKDIKRDLRRKRRSNPRKYAKLVDAINKLYAGCSPEEVKWLFRLSFDIGGLSSELILKVITWFFIEQDMTYWNWEGRGMFKRGIPKVK